MTIRMTRRIERLEYDIPSTWRTTGYAPIYFTYFRDTFGIAITVSSRREVETIYCTAARQNLLLQTSDNYRIARTRVSNRSIIRGHDSIFLRRNLQHFETATNLINFRFRLKYSKMHRLNKCLRN